MNGRKKVYTEGVPPFEERKPNNLDRICRVNEISTTDLASLLDTTYATARTLRRSFKMPSYRHVCALEDYFELPHEYLFSEDLGEGYNPHKRYEPIDFILGGRCFIIDPNDLAASQLVFTAN